MIAYPKQTLRFVLCGLFLSLGQLGAAEGDRFSALLKIVAVNGVQLHYLESGSGVPIEVSSEQQLSLAKSACKT